MNGDIKRIQVCADDYGFDAAISHAILEGIDAGRLSATSCMVLSPVWPREAAALRERVGMADFGLHLDVNEFADLTQVRSLSGWIAAAYRGQIDAVQARVWVARQLDAFEAAMQRPPNHLDGHQHVHQLPGLRTAVLAELTARYGLRCALRSTRSRVWRGPKAAVIAMLGSAALRVQAQGMPMNTDFAGVYDFRPEANFAALVATWLTQLPDCGLLMTHPAFAAGTETRPDPIRAARVKKRKFWLSNEAVDLMARLGVQLGLSQDWPPA